MKLAWRANLLLFVATIGSVFATHVVGEGEGMTRTAIAHGAQFTSALIGILLAHELGHYAAARIHKVEASLPFFLPLPVVSPFGTMGAVIQMRGVIPTRKALLDIGASGPLAGLALAIPLYFWAASHGRFVPASEGVTLGDSLLLRALDHLAVGQAPPGMELELPPVAFAAWAGMFVTMINLIPAGQLDGGHVAYSLFGPRQDRLAVIVHRAMLAFFFVSLASYVTRDLRAGFGLVRMGSHVGKSLFWLAWFEILAVLGDLASAKPSGDASDPFALSVTTRVVATLGLLLVASVGHDHSSALLWASWFAGLAVLLAMEARGGALRPHALVDHPATGSAPLDGFRRAVAVFTLAMFVLLFMPTPMSM